MREAMRRRLSWRHWGRQRRLVLDAALLGVAGAAAAQVFTLLLRTGIPIEVPNGRRLVIGVLRPDSPWRGHPAGVDGRSPDDDTRIFAIIRGNQMIQPGPESTLETGDRLLFTTTVGNLDRLKLHVDKW